jgi:hypothetical protein
MPLPPPNCLDPRLWAAAQELAEAHAEQQGRCVSCGIPAPCRKAEAAEDAMRRAMPAPAPEPPPPPPLPAEAAPVGARFPREPSTPVGARFPRESAAPPAPPALPPTAPEPERPAPVGARFPRERKVGRRRAN